MTSATWTSRGRWASPTSLATPSHRHLDSAAIGALVETFESAAGYLVADHGGRVVKTLGDEVMFVAADVRSAARLALGLAALSDGELPPIAVGLAFGPVVTRVGDVFGPTVNVASRLTGLAKPGTVLVDRDAAANLEDDEEFSIKPLRRRSVRGYDNLAPFLLRPAATD